MSIFSRFFGRNEESADSAALLANPDIAQPLSLQVLFAEPLAITEAALPLACRTSPRWRQGTTKARSTRPRSTTS